MSNNNPSRQTDNDARIARVNHIRARLEAASKNRPGEPLLGATANGFKPRDDMRTFFSDPAQRALRSLANEKKRAQQVETDQ